MRFSDYPISQTIKDQLEVLGYKRPTDIQFKAISPILNGEDVFGIAQTGTGKTAAFAIPIIHKLSASKAKTKGPRCIVMAPTRELAEQIKQEFESIGKGSNIRITAILGGLEQDQQIRELKRGTDVVVATPGRVFDLRSQGYLSLDSIQFLVLDEADRMLDLGFAHDMKAIHKLSPQKNRQTLFFSATIDKKIKALAYELVRDAIRIQISPKDPVSKNIGHSFIRVEMDDKRFFLENIIKEYEELKYVVFVRTKVRCERVVAAMERVGIHSEALHGGIEQKERFQVLERFKSGENKVLITTDVAARGIDIQGVDYVINYDLPEQAEQYVHRIGRTGRGENKGQALSFCSKEEEKVLEETELYLGYDIDEIEISKGDYSAILKDSEDMTYNWQKLLDDANEEDGTQNIW
ncbi:DEAD/DEAH box helicase [Fluviicola sp.]|jgi:ATP-dependent RNA helicase RhlE|uniref:DEAD/DEAH box helicase n=1 Tax=Fluviicola sp. TaxID=1917219 RepID=UPI002839ECF5|nr:DEAD/DEAH box helicase [Fluviicola sp.]MDR0802172.1 DEAD/DEAH box helicase [Fluviicola sp.]